jgi:hypothetical protein
MERAKTGEEGGGGGGKRERERVARSPCVSAWVPLTFADVTTLGGARLPRADAVTGRPSDSSTSPAAAAAAAAASESGSAGPAPPPPSSAFSSAMAGAACGVSGIGSGGAAWLVSVCQSRNQPLTVEGELCRLREINEIAYIRCRGAFKFDAGFNSLLSNALI